MKRVIPILLIMIAIMVQIITELPAADSIRYGNGVSLSGKRLFPNDNPWNKDISGEPVDPNSDALISSIGLHKELHPSIGPFPMGIPYVVVPGTQPTVPITFDNIEGSDHGDYPIPPDAPIEGGAQTDGDRHVLVIDRDRWMLYELFYAFPKEGGKRWHAGSGAIFDLNSNALRPEGITSADAAGLPIFPGLVRYDEVHEQKEITHALRFTAHPTRRGYVYPARHFASNLTDSHLPPMGMRVRLKATYDLSRFPPSARVILTALKKYGMFLSDNGGDWFLIGAPDPRWIAPEIETLKRVKGRDFEVVKMEAVITE